MKKSVCAVLMVGAFLVSAVSAFAVTYQDNVPYCENWKGTWAVTYSGRSDNITADNITIDKICQKGESCLSDFSATPDIWWCQASGKRASDNKTILIAQVLMDPSSYGYYELDNVTQITQSAAYDTIPKSQIDCDSFGGVTAGMNNVNDFGLVSGTHLTVADNCTLPEVGGDNGTDNQTCKLQRIIPSKIGKIMALANPIIPFIIIADANNPFERGSKAEFESTAIRPIIDLRIGSKILVAITFVRPLKLQSGESAVTVDNCTGSITIR